MNRILDKQWLAENVWRFRIEAPLIARRRKAGQFIMLRVREGGERIPLTIADAETTEGSITLIVQQVGKTTSLLADLNVGDFIPDVAGPLGKPTHVEKLGTVVVIGGGIGIAPAHPIAQALRKAGNRVIGILGGRRAEFVIMEEEMRRACDEILIATDDGSKGVKGLVTAPLKDLIERGEPINQVFAIGSPVMMKAVSDLTRPYALPTVVSLNTLMIDGTGMCGGCRIRFDGQNKFVCVDGPEFDGHKVDFDNMLARLGTYVRQERQAFDEYAKSHVCRLERQAKTAENPASGSSPKPKGTRVKGRGGFE